MFCARRFRRPDRNLRPRVCLRLFQRLRKVARILEPTQASSSKKHLGHASDYRDSDLVGIESLLTAISAKRVGVFTMHHSVNAGDFILCFNPEANCLLDEEADYKRKDEAVNQYRHSTESLHC